MTTPFDACYLCDHPIEYGTGGAHDHFGDGHIMLAHYRDAHCHPSRWRPLPVAAMVAAIQRAQTQRNN
jgi:hypothetical protein